MGCQSRPASVLVGGQSQSQTNTSQTNIPAGVKAVLQQTPAAKARAWRMRAWPVAATSRASGERISVHAAACVELACHTEMMVWGCRLCMQGCSCCAVLADRRHPAPHNHRVVGPQPAEYHSAGACAPYCWLPAAASATAATCWANTSASRLLSGEELSLATSCPSL